MKTHQVHERALVPVGMAALARVGLALGIAALVASQARAQCGPERLPQGDPSGDDLFGWSVAADGAQVLVGAPGDDEGRGSVYAFDCLAGHWTEVERLRASDGAPNAHFGHACWIGGGRALVGAPQADLSTELAYAGAVYVFEREPGGWTQAAKLVAADATAFQIFGNSCAAADDVAVVGAPGSLAPGAYVFERQPGGWAQTAKLVPSGVGPSSLFGERLAIAGDTILVPARLDDTGGENRGVVYVFERGPAGWSEVQRLQPEDLTDFAYFGASVALSADTALVGAGGATGAQAFSGAVYVYARFPSGWTQVQKLAASDGTSGDQFGWACALAGDEAWVGAPRDANLGIIESGSVYRFQRPASAWVEAARVGSLAPSLQGMFGYSIAADPGCTILGAPLERVDGLFSGSAYLFPAAEGGVSAFCTSAPNSVGSGARIAAVGTTSVSANDFSLLVTAAVPAQMGLFYYGPQAIEVPFGDGFRCVGGQPTGVFRLNPPQPLNFVGDALRRVDFAQAPANAGAGAILPGSTWCFQFMYRDPHGPGGHGFNFSDGLRATFCP